MAKYTTKDQLIRAIIPEEIRDDCIAMMEAVEQLGSPSYLAIIHTQEELDTITKQVQNNGVRIILFKGLLCSPNQTIIL